MKTPNFNNPHHESLNKSNGCNCDRGLKTKIRATQSEFQLCMNRWKQGETFEHISDSVSEGTNSSTCTTVSQKIMATEQPRECLLEFADMQFMQNVDQMPSMSVIHVELYLRFLKIIEPRRKWNKAALIRFLKKNYTGMTVAYKDKPIRLLGPVRVPVVIDGVEFRIVAGVTLNNAFYYKFILGHNSNIQTCFQPSEEADENQSTDEGPEFQLTMESSTQITFETDHGTSTQEALIDTGAGPSIINAHTWNEISNGHLEVVPTKRNLRDASGGNLMCMGRTPTIKIKIGNVIACMSFIISKHLNTPVILGRDFLYMMDAIVDLPAGKVVLRNSEGRYVKRKCVLPENNVKKNHVETVQREFYHPNPSKT